MPVQKIYLITDKLESNVKLSFMPHVNAVCTNFSQKIIAFARVSKFNSQSENHYGKIYNSSIQSSYCALVMNVPYESV